MGQQDPSETGREYLIRPERDQSLQSQVDAAIAAGSKRIVLDGKFTFEGDSPPFSLLSIPKGIEQLKIIGREGTTLDGENELAHLVFVEDGARVDMRGVCFANGNTALKLSRLSKENHPGNRLNVFRYLDGGAITMGEGSEVVVNGCRFENNHSAICGGAISNLGGYLDLEKCTFEGNTCGDTGAAVDNLASGALTVIRNCTFRNNTANQLDSGTYGAVTAFPDTFLVIVDSDFSGEQDTAIDYKPNDKGETYVWIDEETLVPSGKIVRNPTSTGARKAIVTSVFGQVLARRPHGIRLQRIPRVGEYTRERHKIIYEGLTNGRQGRPLY